MWQQRSHRRVIGGAFCTLGGFWTNRSRILFRWTTDLSGAVGLRRKASTAADIISTVSMGLESWSQEGRYAPR